MGDETNSSLASWYNIDEGVLFRDDFAGRGENKLSGRIRQGVGAVRYKILMVESLWTMNVGNTELIRKEENR